MGMEIRSWTKLNPQGDAYSPRTGHTVTSNGTSLVSSSNRLLARRIVLMIAAANVQTAACTCLAALTAVAGSKISSSLTLVRVLCARSLSSSVSVRLASKGLTRASPLDSSSWSQVQTRGALPPRRSGALGVVDDNKMYIFGGYDGRDGNYFNDLFYFNFGASQARVLLRYNSELTGSVGAGSRVAAVG